MLTLLHVLDSLQVGGTEWQCLSLLRRLDRTRFRSRFVSFHGLGPLQEPLREAAIPSDVIPLSSFRRPSGAAALFRLAALMRRHRVQIVQAYGFYSNLPALLAGYLARVPIRIASRRDMGEFLTHAQRRVERAVFHLATRIVVNARAIKDELVRTGQARSDRIVVIPTGVDLDRFDGAPWPAIPPPTWARNGKVVGMVASFRTQKDHGTFLEAARRVLAADRNVAFIVAGGVFPGSSVTERLRQAAERMVADAGMASSVHFLGAIDPKTIPWILQHIDISVLASKSNEGIPNVVLEAMAAGKPVVATDTGGCREAIQDGVTGFLVPPGDPDRLAERVLRLLRDDGEAARLGKAGRTRVEAEFCLPRMVERFASLYANLLPEPSHRAAEVRA